MSGTAIHFTAFQSSGRHVSGADSHRFLHSRRKGSGAENLVSTSARMWRCAGDSSTSGCEAGTSSGCPNWPWGSQPFRARMLSQQRAEAGLFPCSLFPCSPFHRAARGAVGLLGSVTRKQRTAILVCELEIKIFTCPTLFTGNNVQIFKA